RSPCAVGERATRAAVLPARTDRGLPQRRGPDTPTTGVHAASGPMSAPRTTRPSPDAALPGAARWRRACLSMLWRRGAASLEIRGAAPAEGILMRLVPAHRFCLLITGVLLSLASPADAQQFGRNKVQYETFDFQVARIGDFDIYFYPETQKATEITARL